MTPRRKLGVPPGLMPPRHLPIGLRPIDHEVVSYVVLLFSAVFIASVTFTYIRSAYFGLGYPYNTFLLDPAYRFSDFFDMLRITQGLNPYQDSSRSVYPPVANLFMYGWTLLPEGSNLAAFIGVAWGGFALLIGIAFKSLPSAVRWQVFFALFVGSYPVLFCLDRGNSELYVALLVGVFLLHYRAQGGPARMAAVGGLVFAISLKIVPVVFCFLYFKDRRWRELASVLLGVLAVNLLSLFAFQAGAHLNAAEFLGMLGTAQQQASEDPLLAAFSASLFDGLRVLGWFFGESDFVSFVDDYYFSAAVFVLGAVVIRLLFGRFVVWETAVCLACLGCLLPTISNDYKLCVLLAAVLLLLADHAGTSRRYRMLVLALVAFICAPKNWMIVMPGRIRGDIGLGSILTPLAILTVLGVILVASTQFRYGPSASAAIHQVSSPLRNWIRARYLGVCWAVMGVVLGSWVLVCYLTLGQQPTITHRLLVTSPETYRFGVFRPMVAPTYEEDSAYLAMINVDATLSFTPRQLGQGQNLFATALGERGMRLEYSSGSVVGDQELDGTLVLVLGRRHGGVLVYHLSDQMRRYQTYQLRIVIREAGQVELFLNGERKVGARLPADLALNYQGLRLGSKYDSTQFYLGDLALTAFSVDVGRVTGASERIQQFVVASALVACVLGLGLLGWIQRSSRQP